VYRGNLGGLLNLSGDGISGIGEGVGGRFGSAAQGVLGRVEVGTALVLSTVGVGSGRITDLLSSGLVLTGLEGTSNLVASTGDVLGDDLSGGLLRLRGDLLPDLLTETFTHGVRHVD